MNTWADLAIGDTYRVEWQDHECGGYFTSQLTAINFYEVETDIVKDLRFANGVTITGEPWGIHITPVVTAPSQPVDPPNAAT
jgi:hypothetical protein